MIKHFHLSFNIQSTSDLQLELLFDVQQQHKFISLQLQSQQTNIENNMNRQQKFSHFDELFFFYSSCTFFKGSPLHASLPETSPFKLSAINSLSFQSRFSEESDPQSFETRLQTSIIIQSSTQLSLKLDNPKTGPLKKVKRKTASKKTAQKESRNVISNLIRIFLKNVIELRLYDPIIRKIIQNRGYQTTCQAFHEWLKAFGINFKNYIRFTEVRRVFDGEERREMHAIFRILLKLYTGEQGVSHALTSKRIQRTSTRMHLIGLRNLPKQLGN